jgi:single-stranded DNA-binding protein
MKQAICIAIGRVRRPPVIVEPPNGKPFVAVTVELTRRWYDGKTYAQRIEARVYSKPLEDTLNAIKEGMLVSVSGDIDAFVSEVRGKHYANIRVTGTVVPVATEQEQALSA